MKRRQTTRGLAVSRTPGQLAHLAWRHIAPWALDRENLAARKSHALRVSYENFKRVRILAHYAGLRPASFARPPSTLDVNVDINIQD